MLQAAVTVWPITGARDTFVHRFWLTAAPLLGTPERGEDGNAVHCSVWSLVPSSRNRCRAIKVTRRAGPSSQLHLLLRRRVERP